MKRMTPVVAVLAFHAWAGDAPAADLSCTQDARAGTVTCTLPSDASSIDLKAVLDAARPLNVTLDASSPLVLAAFGGSGAKGDGNDLVSGGDLGAGGSARMATTLADLEKAYGTTTVHYYLGAQGEGNHPGGKGGAATLVSVADLSTTTVSLSNVLLIAGGGGGGGAAAGVYSGHAGGGGGKVASAIGSAASAPGGSGHSGNGSGGGGAGGRGGTGGPGGSAGDGSDAKAGGSGKNGIGGQGGPVHIAHGASTATGWTNVTAPPAGIGTNGEGGEGQVRCDGCGEGGGGGGGYGGGGGGGGGGSSLSLSYTAGGGGGGGGSYAAPSTASSTAAAASSGHGGAVAVVLQGMPGIPTCTLDAESRVVTCLLSTATSSVDLKYAMGTAQLLNPAVNERSPMALTAFGGAGASGDGHGSAPGGDHGAGGSARTVTTLADLGAAYGTTTIHYYLGLQGEGNHPGGKGGSSTIVSVADLSTTAASTAGLLLVAGGGGGGGEAGSASRPGYDGGSGGAAASAMGAAAVAQGLRGQNGAGSGGGGAGGRIMGGAGGSAGDGSDGKPGGAGTDGVGGQGGPVHISDGASTSTGWSNVAGVPVGIGTNGQGGEGQVRCDDCGEGGGGGGGYGGGGGGGGGGYTIESGGTYTAGGGGGGGGSYAAASTAATDFEAKRAGQDGSVVILFEEVCAGSQGAGTAIAQGLLDDFIPVFNAQWPTIAVAEGLDPYSPVYVGSVDVGCGSVEGDAACYAMYSAVYPLCSRVYADVDVSELDGLSDLEVTSLRLESTHQRVGTTCPTDPAAAASASFGCSLYGGSQADVALTAVAKVSVPKIKLKIKCKDIFSFDDLTTTVWAGSAKCSSTSGRATAAVDYCGGLCSLDAGVASLVALKASDLNMKLKPDCSVDTDHVDGLVGEALDALLSDLATALGDTIVRAVTPAVQDALNEVAKKALPLPATCAKESGARRIVED